MAVTTAPRAMRMPSSAEAVRERRLGSLLKYLLLAVLTLVALLPFILALLGTFKTDAEITAWPPTFLPKAWLIQNWPRVWNTDLGQGATFPRWLINTAVIAVGSAILQVVCCTMA